VTLLCKASLVSALKTGIKKCRKAYQAFTAVKHAGELIDISYLNISVFERN